jgi:xylan 1,4-beta-xylosidase
MEEGVRQEPDVGVLASRFDDKLTVLVWHYHDDDLPGSDAEVLLEVANWNSAEPKLAHYRVDENHSNSFTAWKEMGSPQQPTQEQYAELESRMRLAKLDTPGGVVSDGGKLRVKFTLPRAGVSLLVVE